MELVWLMLLNTMTRKGYASSQIYFLEGDSGSLIILTGQDAEKPKPIGIIWDGTANRGRLKLKSGRAPENWTSGVDLGRLLDLLELDLITTSEGLQDALQDQRFALAADINSNVGKSYPTVGSLPNEKANELTFSSSLLKVASGSGADAPLVDIEFQVGTVEAANNVEEHHFKILNLISMSPMHHAEEDNLKRKNVSALIYLSGEDLCVSLHLGDQEPKRQHSDQHGE